MKILLGIIIGAIYGILLGMNFAYKKVEKTHVRELDTDVTKQYIQQPKNSKNGFVFWIAGIGLAASYILMYINSQRQLAYVNYEEIFQDIFTVIMVAVVLISTLASMTIKWER